MAGSTSRRPRRLASDCNEKHYSNSDWNLQWILECSMYYLSKPLEDPASIEWTCIFQSLQIFGFVLQGRADDASELLQLHPLCGEPAYLTMLQLLGNMPVFYDVCFFRYRNLLALTVYLLFEYAALYNNSLLQTAHATGRTFEQRWTYWRSEVISCVQKGAFDGDDHLELLASVSHCPAIFSNFIS